MPALMKGTTTSVGVLGTAVATLLADNPNRFGGSIFNDTGTIVFVLLGDGVVSSTLYTKKLTSSDQYWELPSGWTGMVTAIRNSGSTPQPMYVTEFTLA